MHELVVVVEPEFSSLPLLVHDMKLELFVQAFQDALYLRPDFLASLDDLFALIASVHSVLPSARSLLLESDPYFLHLVIAG